MLPRAYRVVWTRPDTADTVTLALEPDGAAGAAPSAGADARGLPGQFNMLYAFGIGEVPISISGDTSVTQRLIHTVRAVGAVSSALCRLRPGDALGVRGPFGRPWPVDEAQGSDLVIVAGGIGLAPLRPVIYHVLANRERYGRVTLLYGARRPEEMLFVSELQAWRSRLDLDVLVTVDRATEQWRGNVAFVTRLIPRVETGPGTLALVCGPELMMRYAAMALMGLGVSPEHVYVSLERNMNCGVGLCGHCQLGPLFVCRDGPVVSYASVERLLRTAEV
jgi:NAD(P)H-flavin reductase